MVLLVDDDGSFVERSFVSFAPARRMCVAPNGEFALRLVQRLGDDLAIALVDLELPGMSGFDLIREMHKLNETLPVIAISGVYCPDVMESTLVLGAAGILSKPFTKEWNAAVTGAQRKQVFRYERTAEDRPADSEGGMDWQPCIFGHRASTGHFRCVCGTRLTFAEEPTSFTRLNGIHKNALVKSGLCPHCGVKHLVRMN